MYDIQFGLCNEPEVNRIFEKYVQSQMREALEIVIAYKAVVEKFKAGHPLLPADREKLHEHADDFFPEGFDREEIPDTMRELYSIIISDDRYIPSMVEEYVLAAAIEYMADTIRVGEGKLLTDPMPERDKVTAAMEQYYTDEMGDSRQDAERAAEEFVRSIEDFSGIIETCFYDTDYIFLDDYSPEDIVMSGTDDESGMGVMEPARKRLPDGTLEYIGKPMEKEHFTIKLKL